MSLWSNDDASSNGRSKNNDSDQQTGINDAEYTPSQHRSNMLRIFKEVSESYEGLFSSSGNIESAQPSAVRANTLQVFKSSSGRSLSSKSSEGIMSNAVKDESERSEDMSMVRV